MIRHKWQTPQCSIRYKDISDDKVDIAVTKLMLCDTHLQPTTDSEVEKHCQLFVGTDNETQSVAMRISNEDSSLVAIAPARPDPRTGRAI